MNIEVCRAAAVHHGLPLQFVVKEFHVFEVLAQLAALTAHSTGFVFKGGTALNKVYLGETQRFSEDLDFDLGVKGITEVGEYCREIAKKISGYEITEFRRVRGTVQFYCVFNSPLGGKDHVRVDVAAKKILAANPLEMKPAASAFTGSSVSGFRVYSLEDLTARKLHALATRAEGKDIFDVHNALPLCGKMAEAVKKMLESEGSRETPREFVEKAIGRVEKADVRKLRNLTNPLIPSGNRPRDWAELKNDLSLRLEWLAEQV